MLLPILLVAIAAVAAAVFLGLRLRGARAELESVQQRFKGVVDVEAERTRVLSELAAERQRVADALAEAQREAAAVREHAETEAVGFQKQATEMEGAIARMRAEFEALDEQSNLHAFGFYKPRYDFSSSLVFESRLEEIREKQKQMLSAKTAAVTQVEWTVNGNRAEGRKQINQTIKLMLRGFNGECDAAVARVRYNNVNVMSTRIRKAWETINSLAQVQQISITREYLDLKLEELFLAFEYQEKLAQEKEEQRRIREQMREEEQAQRELARARMEAEKEERRYEDALARARTEVERAVGLKQEKLLQQIAELEQRLAEAHARKERAIAQAQLTRSGHVYIISNVGSFGDDVYKIGMTRRLDPFERVKELGDASVPFEFDVHAVIYSEDAPGLENLLHRRFNWRRVNRVNERKEFFRVSIDEIAAAVRETDAEIEVIRDAEAAEYHKTLALLAEEASAEAKGETRLPTAVGADRIVLPYDRRSAPPTVRGGAVGTGIVGAATA